MKGVCQQAESDIAAFNRCVSSLASSISQNTGQKTANQVISAEKQTEMSVFRFAQEHGLKFKIVSCWEQLCNLTFPSVVKRVDGRYIVIIRANNNSVLLFDRNEAKTSIISKDQFLTLWSGHGITFHPDSEF